jgi:hypothetical protein
MLVNHNHNHLLRAVQIGLSHVRPELQLAATVCCSAILRDSQITRSLHGLWDAAPHGLSRALVIAMPANGCCWRTSELRQGEQLRVMSGTSHCLSPNQAKKL